MLECRFESWLGLEFSGFSMWHYLKLIDRGFLRVLWVLPLLHQLIVQTVKYTWKKCDSDSVKLNSWAVPSYHMAHNILHVILSARCVAHDLHRIAPWPLERTCWRQFAAQSGDCNKSQIVPFNVTIIIIIIIIIIVIIIKTTVQWYLSSDPVWKNTGH